MNVKDKVVRLQEILKNKNLDAFMFSTSDDYINEYVPLCFKRLEYLTNFSGSFGFCVITQNKAIVFSDGRYSIALAQQVDGSVFETSMYSLENIKIFLSKNLPAKSTIAIHSLSVRIEEFSLYNNMVNNLDNTLVALSNHLVDEIWSNKPALPREEIFDFDVKYAGKNRQDKLAHMVAEIKNKKLFSYLITQLDNIAWLLNLRGNDVECNPLFLSKMLVRAEGKAILFVDENKLNPDLKNTLLKHVDIYKEENLEGVLKQILTEGKIGLANSSPYYYVEFLKQELINAKLNTDNCMILEDFVSNIKAIKNDVELKNTKSAHIRDASYLIRVIKYIKDNVNKIDEVGLATKIIAERSLDSAYKSESFPAIVGSGSNGAIVHYRADEKTNKKIVDNQYLLLDCGGQYLDGTTDITRSFSFKNVDENYKTNYTLVLKGHIDLAKVIFKVGTKGCELDILARQHLWSNGLDYNHGTGHGVGLFLSVHELGARISSFANVVLQEGMILSNEPGFYLENAYGIRLENLYFVKKSQFNGFLELENLTYVPFEIANIELSLLDKAQLEWLNNYHQKCYQNALDAKILSTEELTWLKDYMKI